MNKDSLQYIAKIDQLPLWNAGLIELFDFSRANENEESRIEAIAAVASICHGKPPKDAKKLVERLWREPNGLPSSAIEFVRDGSGPYYGIDNSLRNTQLATHIELAKWPEMGIEDTGAFLAELAEAHKRNIATFRLKVPIFIARQVMRHRAFSYQELSRRFVGEQKVSFEFWRPPADELPSEGMDFVWGDGYDSLHALAIETYIGLLERGVQREVARAVLPQSLYTIFWIQGHVPAWKNYFKLRTDSHAQKEHRQLAKAMLELLKKHQSELYEKVKP